MNIFKNRTLVIATQHKKETVIAPLIEKALGVNCIPNKIIDTDSLGTFSGEVERQNDPISTVRQKCLMAMQAHNCDLGIASEGSFGNHPSMFFVPADDEFIIFIDQANNIEIIARELSTSTNFGSQEVNTESELLEFAERSKFPSHGLILRGSKDSSNELYKGLSEKNELIKIFHELRQAHTSILVETDMRAMFNPTRMAVIESATEKLIEKIKSTCPNCKTPGFSIIDSLPGLPCNQCSSPTRSTKTLIYGCSKCKITVEKANPKKSFEEPMYCDFCNP